MDRGQIRQIVQYLNNHYHLLNITENPCITQDHGDLIITITGGRSNPDLEFELNELFNKDEPEVKESVMDKTFIAQKLNLSKFIIRSKRHGLASVCTIGGVKNKKASAMIVNTGKVVELDWDVLNKIVEKGTDYTYDTDIDF
jgi:hypothetical protein